MNKFFQGILMSGFHSQEDFDGLNSRVRHYMQWNSNNPHYLTLNEVHTLFIDYFLQLSAKFVKKEEGFDFGDPFNDVVDHGPAAAKTSVSIDEWVEVWGELVLLVLLVGWMMETFGLGYLSVDFQKVFLSENSKSLRQPFKLLESKSQIFELLFECQCMDNGYVVC